MARIKNNIIIEGISGTLGDMLVFRQLQGKTVLSLKPKQTAQKSEKQLAHMKLFKEAVLYGKSVLADPSLMQEYGSGINERMQSAYIVAITDFLNSPVIHRIDISSYKGRAGDPIVARITDDFKVLNVKVEIRSSKGFLIEQGVAVMQDNKLEWLYTTTVSTDIKGSRITIRAYDMPGNETAEERVVL